MSVPDARAQYPVSRSREWPVHQPAGGKRDNLPTDRYIGLKALSAYSGLSVRTLRSRLTHRVRPLPHFKLDGKVLVRVSEFDGWLEQFRRPGHGQDPVTDAVDALLEALEVRA